MGLETGRIFRFSWTAHLAWSFHHSIVVSKMHRGIQVCHIVSAVLSP